MKKWLIAVLAVSVLLVLSTYLFIPSKLTVSSIVSIRANENGTLRFVSDQNKWAQWWNYTPDSNKPKPEAIFICNSNKFTLSEKLYKSVKVKIENNNHILESMVNVFPLGLDSTAVEWKYSVAASLNPFKRIANYFEAKEIKGCMNNLLGHLKNFLQKKENVYGISFDKISFKDSLLISTKSVFETYPSTVDIYGMIKNLKDYAASNGAEQVGQPIYNITETDKKYNIMVALPVNKVLPEANQFVFKKMIPGSFIVTTVKGGEQTINNALQQVHQYFEDYRQTSMAINFRMLITDRTIEADSAKWVTKIYQPVY